MERGKILSKFVKAVPKSSYLGSKTEAPAEAAFEGAEERLMHPAEIGLFDLAVLNVVRDAVREDVFDLNVEDAKTVALKQFAPFPACIGVGDRTARLRFRNPRIVPL